MNPSLRQLRAFVSVAHLKSFTRAASVLHLSQPALTVQIRRLEEALAVRLLDRNTRAVELTRVGRELVPVFQRLLRELDTVVIDTRDLAAKRYGVVRVAALPSVAAGVLPDAIAAFREANPRITFVLKDVIASRVLNLVRTEEVDLGVTGGDLVEPDIEVVCTAHDRMHVVFPAEHPIEVVPEVTLDVLASYPLILMDPDTSVRAVVDGAFIAAGRLPIPACEATYMMTAVGMVRAGLGIAILPALAREVRAEPSLRSRPIDDPSFGRTLSVIKKAGRTLPPASATFLLDITRALSTLDSCSPQLKEKS
jgi:DNA-binding transcriptional LysR family regulator